MVLSLQNVAYYLMDCGLVVPGQIVEGDLTIIEVVRRNLNFKIIRKKAPGLFVKQIRVWNPQISAEMQREAICYWLSQHEPAFAPLRGIVPTYRHYDAARCILVTELFPDGQNISEYHRRLGRFPTDLAVLLAKQMAAYHQINIGALQNKESMAGFPKAAPWVLSVHRQEPGQSAGGSSANTQMIAMLQQYAGCQEALDGLRNQWQANRLIHGDMKWDNCVIETNHDSTTRLKIVDWELADIGDAGWDVGAIFQAYLSFWILSINITSGSSPAQWLRAAVHPIETMQPAMRAFWDAYCKEMKFSGSDAETWLQRSVKFAAARMIQTVYEYMGHSPQLTPNALCLLQVSMNILQKPQETIRDLLAL
jgi:thiamine kinase-like enzyme